MKLFSNNMDILLGIWEHLEIVSFAVGCAIIIGVPVGILVSKKKSLAKPVLSVASVFQTIPSLALFGLLIPLLGIGIVPSVSVLFLYALLPIITNTYIGITGIDENYIEAARGIGLDKSDILFKVELPLSVPIIMGGIKISAVACVGTATIAALIGAGGLGEFIFRGISTGSNNLILKGAVPAALLAIVINSLFSLVETSLKPRENSIYIHWSQKYRKSIVAFAAIVFFIPLFVSSVNYFKNKDEAANTIIIGHKSAPEQRILGEMFGLLIEDKTELKTKVLEFGGTQVVFSALTNNEVDVYPEYTGTAYGSILAHKTFKSASEVAGIAKSELYDKYKVVMLDPMKFNNTYTFLGKEDFLKQYNIKNVSDLQKYNGRFTLAVDNEFKDREDGIANVESKYGLTFKKVNSMDPGLLVTAVINDRVDLSVAYGTDGRITGGNLKIIEDDKGVFPPYNVAALVTEEFGNEHPEVVDALETISGEVTTEEMQELNYLASDDRMTPREVAYKYLSENGYITPKKN